MKKILLLSAVVVSGFCGYSQHRVSAQTVLRKVDRTAELAALNAAAVNESKQVSQLYGSGEMLPISQKPSPPSSYNWSLLCGSMNAYGMLGSNQKPLQYHPQLNAVSFIHRKSDFYTEVPALPSTAKAGVILAEISTDWGGTWDSTNIYSNATDWGRYPQGAIYNPTGNTTLSNAYVVGSGPTVGSASFSGNWYASKKLNTFDATASAVPGAQQFFTFTGGTYPADMNRHAWPRNGFSITNDGVAHALGVLGNDLTNTTTMRGYAVITGTFNGSTFDWKMDSIIPNCILKADGVSKHLQEGQMIWNPAGTIGYVVGIGVKAGATLANRSYQPIIYKMDKNQGASATWTLVNQLDFNTTYTTISQHLPGRPVTYPTVTGDTTAVPFTNDFDLAIDANNNLHIGIVFMCGYSDHPDSLQYYTSFGSAINAGESYKWQHLPGDRPYIYDFIGNGTATWNLVTVDSISSEGPGFATGQSGYNDNPWDPSGPNGQKLSVDSRLQMGRTLDGQYICFSWGESDSAYTNAQLKYNTLPDIKARLMALSSGTNTYVMDAGPDLNVSGNDNNVRSRAVLHYMAPVTSNATVFPSVTSTYTVDVRMPFTVTSSNPYSQLTNNATWFGNNLMSFKFSQPSTVGLAKNSLLQASSALYPNPAQSHAVLAFALNEAAGIKVEVLSAIGAVVKQIDINATAGENKIAIDLNGIASGIYFVNVSSANQSFSKKLIIE